VLALTLLMGGTMNLRITVFAPIVLALAACGGIVENKAPEGNAGPGPAQPGQVVPDQTEPGSGGGGGNCTAFPSCDGSDQRVASSAACPLDDARCYSKSLCGQTIWCAEPVANCLAMPTCAPGQQQVQTCPDAGVCTEVSLCGQTITCTDTVQCAGYPSCDGGDTEVSDASACLQDDAACYQRSMCGATIWCTGPR